MSFIRCLSNPEGLYIWHDVGNFIAITGDQIPGIWEINTRHWYGLLRQYRKNSRTCKYGSISIRENENFKVVLKTPHGEIEMWLVTWDYIARHG
jgi:hypothetical protein